MRGARDAAGLRRLAEALIQSPAKASDPNGTAEVVLALVETLASLDDSRAQNLSVARKCIVWVWVLDNVDVDLRLELASRLTAVGSDMVKLKEHVDLPSIRRDDAVLLLRWYSQIGRTIDPGWDASDVPQTNVPLPDGAIGATGGAPQATIIRDPAVRLRYERLIEENRRKTDAYAQQIQMRRAQKRLAPMVVKYLGTMYALAPDHRDELRKLIDQAELDRQTQAQILHEVDCGWTDAGKTSRPANSGD